MDVNGAGNGNINLNMNLRDWGFLDPPTAIVKSHLGLQLMPSIAEKPVWGGGSVRENQHSFPVMGSTNGGPFHHHRVGGISECHHIPTEYWMNQNIDKFVDVLSGNCPNAYYQPSYGILGETSSAHSTLVPQLLDSPKDEHIISRIEKVCEERDNGGNGCGVVTVKKRAGGKSPKSPPREKKPRTRISRAESNEIPPRSRAPKKHAEVVINGVNMDISELPIPVCSCTETPQQCYRWGSGGWQSACCTTGLSLYPLPLSTKRRGARIAGRKMSIGAFKKVLEKLASEGYNFSKPIDLRSYWAKHGTNKFVTIR